MTVAVLPVVRRTCCCCKDEELYKVLRRQSCHHKIHAQVSAHTAQASQGDDQPVVQHSRPCRYGLPCHLDGVSGGEYGMRMLLLRWNLSEQTLLPCPWTTPLHSHLGPSLW